jgi:SAM-dependent methyltransferase
VYEGRELEALTNLANYQDWILQGFALYLRGRVAELGAGIGTMTVLLRPLVDSLVAVEPATNLLSALAQRLAGIDVGIVTATASAYLQGTRPASLDAIVMINVLEHIGDDQDVLRACRRALSPGGHLLLFVPALPGLFSALDRRFGHFRRYRRTELEAGLLAADFSIARLAYMDLSGVPAWRAACRFLWATRIPVRSARAYDRFVVPLMRAVERIVRPPFGKSLIAAARA